MEALRTCSKCSLEAFTREDLEEFCKDSRAPYGRANKCKLCHTKQYRPDEFVEKVSLEGTAALRSCNRCNVKAFTLADLNDFQRASGAMFGRANLCKPCAVKKAITNTISKPAKTDIEIELHRVVQRERHLKKAYNLTLKDFAIMLESQDNVCKICKCEAHSARNAFREHLVVDHCHDTGEVRGLLCSQCNIGLGSFKDNLKLVAEAAEYLKETQA